MAGSTSMLPIQRRSAPSPLGSFRNSTPKTAPTDGTPCGSCGGSVRRWADYTPTPGGPLTASRRSLGDGPATLWPPTPSPMAAQHPHLMPLDSSRIFAGCGQCHGTTSASAGKVTIEARSTASAPTAALQPASAPLQLGSAPATQVVWVPMQVPMQAAPATQGTIIQPTSISAGNVSSVVAQSQVIQITNGQPVSQAAYMQVDGEPPQPLDAKQQSQIVGHAGRQLFSEALDANVIDGNHPKIELPSPGSALHGTGRCNPCAWFWKPSGCQNGANCQYCHLCPEGELKARKKAKVQAIRMGAVEPAPRTATGVPVAPAALKLTSLI